MPPRIPTQADFTPLLPTLPHTLHFPSPPESTTAILILFHGLGDHEVPFGSFARNLNLPGVLAISVRGTAPLPAAMAPDAGPHFHWGDDLVVSPATGELDDDPGFAVAEGLVLRKLVRETLVERCGWKMSDVILFGFGQGGSLALGLASRLRQQDRVVDVTEDDKKHQGDSFKGVVSIGGPLPQSMVPTISARGKSKTSVLVCQLDEDKVDDVKQEFEDVRVVQWKRRDIAMPRDREEVFPIMKFFADRLRAGWD